MRRKQLSLISAFFLLAVLIAGIGWLIYSPIHQERLNHGLIAAIKHKDSRSALALLTDGADPNSKDEPPKHQSLWRILLDRLQGKRPAPSTAPTALLLVCSWEEDKAGEMQIPDNAVLVKTLLDKGAAIEVIDHRDLGRGAGMELQRTPLLWATGW